MAGPITWKNVNAPSNAGVLAVNARLAGQQGDVLKNFTPFSNILDTRKEDRLEADRVDDRAFKRRSDILANELTQQSISAGDFTANNRDALLRDQRAVTASGLASDKLNQTGQSIENRYASKLAESNLAANASQIKTDLLNQQNKKTENNNQSEVIQAGLNLNASNIEKNTSNIGLNSNRVNIANAEESRKANEELRNRADDVTLKRLTDARVNYGNEFFSEEDRKARMDELFAIIKPNRNVIESFNKFENDITKSTDAEAAATAKTEQLRKEQVAKDTAEVKQAGAEKLQELKNKGGSNLDRHFAAIQSEQENAWILPNNTGEIQTNATRLISKYRNAFPALTENEVEDAVIASYNRSGENYNEIGIQTSLTKLIQNRNEKSLKDSLKTR